MERRYKSRLRDEQQEMTRTRIMDALAALITEGRIHDLTVQDVADRSGVSYGTVYRHFPTREALLEAFYNAAPHRHPSLPPMPEDLAGLPAVIREHLKAFELVKEPAMALAMVTTAMGVRPHVTLQRDAHMQGLIRAGVPGIDERELRLATAVLRHLSNLAAWAAMRSRYGLSADETADALAWALEVLVDHLKQRTTEGERV